MGRKRVRAIGQFCWLDADVGVECLRCGRVAIFCDWEAEKHFRERGWSVDVNDAVKRFRCRCGSRDVRLQPVLISMRPQPIPVRPAALRPIYAEDARSLSRRGRSLPTDAAAIEAALDVVRAVVDSRAPSLGDGALTAALATLRPYCYTTKFVDGFMEALAPAGDSPWGGQAVRMALTGILRQLGRPPE